MTKVFSTIIIDPPSRFARVVSHAEINPQLSKAHRLLYVLSLLERNPETLQGNFSVEPLVHLGCSVPNYKYTGLKSSSALTSINIKKKKTFIIVPPLLTHCRTLLFH